MPTVKQSNTAIYRLVRSVFIFLILLTPLIPNIASQNVLASPPDSTILKWAIIDTPGNMPDKNDVHLQSEINAIVAATDSKTIYAIDIPNATPAPIVNPGIWKSSDGGVSWSSKPTQCLVQAIPTPTLPIMDVALAPDNPDLIAIVCLNNTGTLRHEVYLSEDGGSTWGYTGAIPWVYGGNEQIGDIAISTGYKGASSLIHDIIVCSRNPNDSNSQGELYVFRYPYIDTWQAQGFTSGDAIAIKCSPNYTADFSLVVMAATTQRTHICLGQRDVIANTCLWNKDTGWPVEMCAADQCGGTSSGEDRIITGDIILPNDFLGTSHEKRTVFATYDSNNTAMGLSQVLDDIYRLNNTTVTKLRMPGCGNSARISTIAYCGNSRKGKLLSGEVSADASMAACKTWTCLDPLSSCPTWKCTAKPSTGGGNSGYANAQLAWLSESSDILCATGTGNRDTPQKWADPNNPSWGSQSLDESAVSISKDNGQSWNQIGLIDTEINRFKSVAVANDEKTLYLASANDIGFDSLWRSQSPILGEVWERVMCFSGESSILRLAVNNENGADIFWADQGTKLARSSTDSGQTWLDCLPNVIIQDMATTDKQTLYILEANGKVRRGSHTTTWLWDKSIDSSLDTAHTIVVHGENVLVGAAKNSSSPAAYSIDGGMLWTKISNQTPSSGNRHVAFDTNFDDNHIIYIADDSGGIYRWTIDKSQNWDDLAPPNHSFYGLGLGSWGTLYGVQNQNESGVDRALYPRSGIPKPSIYWDSLSTGLITSVKFNNEPNALSLSHSTLWAIDNQDYNPTGNQGCLWAFQDTLARARPTLLKPEESGKIGCDPVSGRNEEIDLIWEQLSLANTYELQVAKDDDFSLRISEVEPATNPYYQPPASTNPAYRIKSGMLPEANAIYYWRIRVRQAATGQIIRSQWSNRRPFEIKAGLPVRSTYPGPHALNPNHCAHDVGIENIAFSWTPFHDSKEYKFVLAQDSALQHIIFETTVPTTAYEYKGRLRYNTSYFWQVIATKPTPSEPSPVFSFVTENIVTVPPAAPQIPHQLYHWFVAIVLSNILGDIIILATIVLILRSQQW